MPTGQFFRDFWTFLQRERRHWLAISAVVLVVLAVLLAYVSGVVDPFMYSLF